MAAIDDLTAKLTQLQTDVAAAVADVKVEIADGKNILADIEKQLATGSGASPAQIQALSNMVDNIDTAVKGAVANVLPPPPTVTLTAPATGAVGATLTFAGTAAAVAPATRIVSMSLDFGDKTAPATGTASSVSATHAYAAAGTYTAVLSVTDNGGQTSTATASIVVS